jgi:hypothetical protein
LVTLQTCVCEVSGPNISQITSHFVSYLSWFCSVCPRKNKKESWHREKAGGKGESLKEIFNITRVDVDEDKNHRFLISLITLVQKKKGIFEHMM